MRDPTEQSGTPEAATIVGEVVPSALEGERLDRVVAILTGRPRSRVNDLLEKGAVSIGTRVVTSRTRKLRAGERLTVVLDTEPILPPAAPDPSVKVPVVYQDEAIIVVDKPAGLVVHPGAGNATGTMVQGLLASFPDLEGMADDTDEDGGSPDRPGIVHRLDKGTSGLLVVARSAEVRNNLVAQLAARQVERVYSAVVSGRVDADEGLIDAPLGRSRRDPTRFSIHSGGKEARTRYLVLRRMISDGASWTLLECRLETGRTHQIRVHLAAIGHPVLNDRRYGGSVPPSGTSAPSAGLDRDRNWLHAGRLGFTHPLSGDQVTFSSPLPSDLQLVLAGMTDEDQPADHRARAD
jgi:23S rRNA pseudouridine1911/1915/1917 synthase